MAVVLATWPALALLAGGCQTRTTPPGDMAVMAPDTGVDPATQMERVLFALAGHSVGEFDAPLYEVVPAAFDVIEHGEQFTLYSLKPNSDERPGRPRLDRHRILGQVEVRDPATQAALRRILARGLNHDRSLAGLSGCGCFFPHHAVRITRGAQTVVVPICFTCKNMVLLFGEGRWGREFDPGDAEEALFDGILKAAGVPLMDEEDIHFGYGRWPRAGGLTVGDLRAGMRKVQPYVAACHAPYHESRVGLTILPSGKVKRAGVDSLLKGTLSGACVERALRNATFARFSGAPVDVYFEFALH